MPIRENQEQKLLQEIKDLSEKDIEKIIRIIHFLKKEILAEKKEETGAQVMNYAGILEDLTEEEAELFDRAVQRKSLFRGREVAL